MYSLYVYNILQLFFTNDMFHNNDPYVIFKCYPDINIKGMD